MMMLIWRTSELVRWEWQWSHSFYGRIWKQL